MNRIQPILQFVVLTLALVPGCVSEQRIQERLQGSWDVDLERTIPAIHEEIRAAKARNPELDAESLERDLTDFHRAQGFVISNATIMVHGAKSSQAGTCEIEHAKGDVAVLREFYGTIADDMSPQKYVEHLQMESGEVPLHTGVHFIDDDHFRIFKLQAIDGRVTKERFYGYETFMREVETANKAFQGTPTNRRP
jgi:hypothetical protein